MKPAITCSITIGPETRLSLPSSKGTAQSGEFCGCWGAFFLHGAIPDVRRFAAELLAECERLEQAGDRSKCGPQPMVMSPEQLAASVNQARGAGRMEPTYSGDQLSDKKVSL
ncbi:MAG TPA: hypothetical protein VNH83_12575 [Bryobacteraceae bacterium]|nr:hypothetical protein [Bryobacteraceae bacterium]